MEVADVFRRYGQQYTERFSVPADHLKVIWAIKHCRTAKLGRHINFCTNCGYVSKFSYNSCRNRHCPKCQWHKQQHWIQQRLKEVLPVPYYHIVFTLPHKLNPLVLCNPKLIFDLLFQSAWQAVQTLCKNPKHLGAQTGMIAVLHTWGQNLSLHPHIHILIPSGGLSFDNKKWINPKSKTFFLPVKPLSILFKNKFLCGLKKLFNHKVLLLRGDALKLKNRHSFQSLIDGLFHKSWVVFSKRPFAGPPQILAYLGRYTHRVAISNARIIKIQDAKVFFQYKDYRQNGTKKVMGLNALEFIRRFLLHVLPKGFTRIRYFGILSIRNRHSKLLACQQLCHKKHAPGQEQNTRQPIFPAIRYANSFYCPHCGKNTIKTLFLPEKLIRPPPDFFILLNHLKNALVPSLR